MPGEDALGREEGSKGSNQAGMAHTFAYLVFHSSYAFPWVLLLELAARGHKILKEFDLKRFL